MTWAPVNNQYDGLNSTVVNDVELNAPFYKWDLQYFSVPQIYVFPPLLTYDPGFDPDDPTGEGGRPHCMRVMIVPPEMGRCC
jgi:hypothetical protein